MIFSLLYLGPELVTHFSCSTQLSMKFILLKNVKMPTIVGILTNMNRKNSILGQSEPEHVDFLDIFIHMSNYFLCSIELSMKKSFITSGPGSPIWQVYVINIIKMYLTQQLRTHRRK